MTDIFGVKNSKRTTTRPAHVPSTSNDDTWYDNCSAPGAGDGTVLTAEDLNFMLANKRSLVRGANLSGLLVGKVDEDPASDDLLKDAIELYLKTNDFLKPRLQPRGNNRISIGALGQSQIEAPDSRGMGVVWPTWDPEKHSYRNWDTTLNDWSVRPVPGLGDFVGVDAHIIPWLAYEIVSRHPIGVDSVTFHIPGSEHAVWKEAGQPGFDEFVARHVASGLGPLRVLLIALGGADRTSSSNPLAGSSAKAERIEMVANLKAANVIDEDTIILSEGLFADIERASGGRWHREDIISDMPSYDENSVYVTANGLTATDNAHFDNDQMPIRSRRLYDGFLQGVFGQRGSPLPFGITRNFTDDRKLGLVPPVIEYNEDAAVATFDIYRSPVVRVRASTITLKNPGTLGEFAGNTWFNQLSPTGVRPDYVAGEPSGTKLQLPDGMNLRDYRRGKIWNDTTPFYFGAQQRALNLVYDGQGQMIVMSDMKPAVRDYSSNTRVHDYNGTVAQYLRSPTTAIGEEVVIALPEEARTTDYFVERMEGPWVGDIIAKTTTDFTFKNTSGSALGFLFFKICTQEA